MNDLAGEQATKPLAADARAMAAAWQIPASAGLALAGAPLMGACLTDYVRRVNESPASLRPRDSLSIEPSLPTGRLVQALGIEGPCTTFGSWPGGGWHALGWALAQLETRRTDRFLVGAWERDPSRIVWLYLGTGVAGLALLTDWRWLSGGTGRMTPLDSLVSELEAGMSVSLEVDLVDSGVAVSVRPTHGRRGVLE
jgi:hypothetical protein